MSVAVKNKPRTRDLNAPYPKDSNFGEWFISRELSTFVVKRFISLPDGERTAQRYPRKDYAALVDAYSDRELADQTLTPGAEPKPSRKLEDFVIRLNGKDPKAERLKLQVRIQHAWINDEFLDQYKQDAIYSSVSDRINADALFNYLTRYGLYWFVTLKKLNSPLQWKAHEKEWGRYLMNRKVDQKDLTGDLRIFRDVDKDDGLRTPQTRQLSAKVLGYVVYEMNRFVRYCYDKRRKEFEDERIELVPWGDDLLKHYEAEWKVVNPPRPTRYIKKEHWEKIQNALTNGYKVKSRKGNRIRKDGTEKEAKLVDKEPPSWRFQVFLAKGYGLRRNETMGLEYPGSVQTKYLLLNKQLKKYLPNKADREAFGDREFKPLKGRETERKIEHTYANQDAKATARWVRDMLKGPLPTPDTVSKEFRQLCADLELPDYWFHDLRRTFITDCVRNGVKADDLRLAVGHKDIRTTMQFYVEDSRDLENDIVVLEEDDSAT